MTERHLQLVPEIPNNLFLFPGEAWPVSLLRIAVDLKRQMNQDGVQLLIGQRIQPQPEEMPRPKLELIVSPSAVS